MSRIPNRLAALLFLLTLFCLNGCGMFLENDCPPGWLMNATGDCIDPSSLIPDGDGPETLHPCPEGYFLNGMGYCQQKPDLDKDNADLPDRDPSEFPDGDEDFGHDEPVIDGDSPVHTTPCDSDADCPFGNLCHTDIDGGICWPSCRENWECKVWLNDGFCNSEQRCIHKPADGPCDDDAQCPFGEVCHDQVEGGLCHPLCYREGDCDQIAIEYFCNSENRCAPDPGEEPCERDSDCGLDEVCHLQIGEGECHPECFVSYECNNYGVDEYICNAAQQCIPDPGDDGCEDDYVCEFGNVCHPEVDGGAGRCLATCTDRAFCQAIESSLFCNAYARCTYPPAGAGCVETADCPINSVCHPEAGTDGTCAPPCDSHSDCELIDSNLACNALGRCIPDLVTDGDIVVDGDHQPDGDLDDVPDGDLDLEPEQEEDTTSGCVRLGQGSVYTINIKTAWLTVLATKDGQNYIDPTGQSGIYIRDNTSGMQVKVISNFSDGGTLPPVEIVQGDYNLIAQNRYSQRQTVVNNTIINRDRTIEVPFPFHTITLHLKKNGQPFPLLDQAYRGSLYMVDRSTRRKHFIAETGGDTRDFNIDVFSGSYDILFEGYLANQPNSFQIDTLIDNESVTEDRELILDLETVTLSGSITINGQAPPADEDGRGEVWLINAVKGNRFPFWPLGTTGSVLFERELLADTYFIAYSPQGNDGESYLWREQQPKSWLSNATSVLMDIPRVHVQGQILAAGQPLSNMDHVNLDRGQVYLVDQTSSEQLLLADLGRQGDIDFDLDIGPGLYSYRFEGRLLDNEYFVGRSYPPITHKVVWKTDVEINEDATLSVDLPLLRIHGQLTKNGEALSNGPYAAGEYVTVRRQSTYEDLPILHFGDFTGPSYEALLFPATYDMRYAGSSLMGSFQNFYVYDEFMLTDTQLEFDIDFTSKLLGLTIEQGEAEGTLSDLIDDGVFSYAEVQVVDHTINNRTTGSTLLQNGRFQMERAPGDYSFILRVMKDASYQDIPVIKHYELTDHDELSTELDFVSFAVHVLKNGEPLPDAENNMSRGDIVLRVTNDYLFVTNFDLGKTGDVNELLTTVPGEYSANVSIGYSDAFQFPQWVYLECVEVVGP